MSDTAIATQTEHAPRSTLAASMFTIARHHADYEAIRFVARAVDDDETRPYYVLHVEDVEGIRFAVGTDSRRMHYAPVSDDVPVGDYRIHKANTQLVVLASHDMSSNPWMDHSLGGKYCNWRYIVDGTDNHVRMSKDDSHIEIKPVKNDNGISIGRVIACFARAQLPCVTLHTIATNYLADLAGYSWEIKVDGDNVGSRAVVFTNQTLSAIIMPARAD